MSKSSRGYVANKIASNVFASNFKRFQLFVVSLQKIGYTSAIATEKDLPRFR